MAPVEHQPSPPAIAPRVVYSRRYDIGFFGLERLHPFDTRKHSRAYALLRRRLGRSKLNQVTLAPPRPLTEDELLAVHTPQYLRRLREPAYLARALEVPPVARIPAWLTDWCVLRHMRWSAMGTLVAAREAVRGGCGLAVNLSGGYHHAGPDRGEGFCVYNDVALAVDDLRRSGALSNSDRVAYVDLDAHQGNGVCRAFLADPRVFILDMFNRSIYPAGDAEARRRIDCAVPLPHGCAAGRYLADLRAALPPFLDAVTKSARVGLAVYNAGTDVYEGDALGGMRVPAEGILERDRFVIEQLAGRRLPTVMLLSGGYSPESYRLVADTVEWVLRRWGDATAAAAKRSSE